ncbi:MAG: class I SAM-dependent methyltransferase, partial [Polyangiaceae bacterium]
LRTGLGMAAQESTHYDGQDLEALADMQRYQRWVLESFRGRLKGRVLEVGAGIGNLAEHYVDDAGEAVLIEPSAQLAERLQARFAGRAHVRSIAGLLEDAERDLAPASFDACILVNVLEHVEDDGAMLRRLRALLKPSGSLLLFVPALPALYGTLDALVHHHRRYTKASLRSVVESAEFTVYSLRYFDVLGIIPWLFAGRILRRQRFDEGASQLYDRFVVPIGAALERRIEPALGKNLVCIAEPRGPGIRSFS